MTRISDRTVLFADLRGSTALFETLGNAEATSVVTHCVNALGGPVAGHRGHVVIDDLPQGGERSDVPEAGAHWHTLHAHSRW